MNSASSKNFKHKPNKPTIRKQARPIFQGYGQTIVIDTGLNTVRAGFAGEESPRCIFSNTVVRKSITKTMGGCMHPVQAGILDWYDIERLWNYTFKK